MNKLSIIALVLAASSLAGCAGSSVGLGLGGGIGSGVGLGAGISLPISTAQDEPQLITPAYPVAAQAQGIEGKVVAVFIVTKKGKAEQIKLEGDVMFFEEVMRALKGSTFEAGHPGLNRKEYIFKKSGVTIASGSADSAPVGNFVRAVAGEVKTNMHDYQQFEGKACALRMHLMPDGQLLDVKSEGGDPALCEATIAAVKASKLPAVPAELQNTGGVYMDFRP